MYGFITLTRLPTRTPLSILTSDLIGEELDEVDGISCTRITVQDEEEGTITYYVAERPAEIAKKIAESTL